jgi:hypothetical protein
VGPIEVGLPLQILLLLRKSRLIILQLSSGNVDLRLKVARVDLEEQVALPDLLIVSDGNLYNRTRDSRCDADDVGTDLARCFTLTAAAMYMALGKESLMTATC